MVKAYRAMVTTRWFGAPCEDRKIDLGLVWFEPLTVDKAREAVAVMGFKPLNSENDEVDEDMGACIEIEIPERFENTNAESAWIDIII